MIKTRKGKEKEPISSGKLRVFEYEVVEGETEQNGNAADALMMMIVLVVGVALFGCCFRNG